jgi:hypothetical protein
MRRALLSAWVVGWLGASVACAEFGSTHDEVGSGASDAASPDAAGPDAAGGYDAGGYDARGPAAGVHLVAFITNSSYAAPPNGATADAYCRTEAEGRLPGKFVAWIPDGATPAVERLVTTAGAAVNGPWFRVDGQLLAKDQAALVSAATTPLASPMELTSAGRKTAAGIFTYTRANGSIGTRCPGATPPTIGVGGMTDGRWTESTTFTPSCQDLLGLYCFQVE